MEEEQDGEHGLVDVAVADALVDQVAGVPQHGFQRVLAHDAVELVGVEVLEDELLLQLPKVAHGGAAEARVVAAAAVSQVEAAVAAVEAHGRAAVARVAPRRPGRLRLRGPRAGALGLGGQVRARRAGLRGLQGAGLRGAVDEQSL